MIAYENGLNVANSWKWILACGHLYNCLRQEGALGQQWTDMEHVFSSQGMAKSFVGGAPKSLNEYWKRFALAFGVSPATFGRNRRNLGIDISSARARVLEKQVPISWIFKHRYCDESRRVDLKPGDVDKVLYDGAEPGKGKSIKSNAKVGLCALLHRLARALDQEASELTFGYFEMAFVCFGILRLIRDGAGSSTHSDRQLPSLVAFLMTEAAFPHEKLFDGREGKDVLEEVGNILDNALAADGDRMTKKRASLLNKGRRSRPTATNSNRSIHIYAAEA